MSTKNKKASLLTHRVCKKCVNFLPFADFKTDSAGLPVTHTCKNCDRRYHREYKRLISAQKPHGPVGRPAKYVLPECEQSDNDFPDNHIVAAPYKPSIVVPNNNQILTMNDEPEVKQLKPVAAPISRNAYREAMRVK